MDKVLWIDTAKSLYNIKSEIKKLRELEEELSTKLQELSEFQSQRIENMAYSFSEVRGNVDYSLVPQLRNVDLNKYRKPAYLKWSLTVEAI